MAPREFDLGRLDVQDLEETVAGLLGLYTSHDLYTRYCARAVANGREPESDNVFYHALTHFGYVKETVRGVSCRVIASDGDPFPGDIEPVKKPAPRLPR